MATVRDILSGKGRHLHSIGPHATVLDAAVLMNEHKIGSLLVLDAGRLAGIITERDILQRVVVPRRDSGHTQVHEVMTSDVICCEPGTLIEEARSVMKNRRIRHLPVLDSNGQLCGLISIGDLNAHEANSKETTIHLLNEYIHGRV
jgi:CBS domain-containing protein